jgi:hypothetical protein
LLVLPGITDPGPLPRPAHPMTTATAPRTTCRTAGQSAEQRRARQDELLAQLADGVLELTTSQGWRRYLRRWPPCAPIRVAIAGYPKPVNAPANGGSSSW